MTVIDTGAGDAWGSVERWWIQWHRERGFRLTNATEGGEGTPGSTHSEETRAKMSRSRLGKKLSAETIAKMAEGRVGVKQAPERVAKRIAAVKATWERKKAAGWTAPPCGPERMAAAHAANVGRPRSAETKARISAAKKGRTHNSPETRAKMSVAAKARRKLSAPDPVY